MGQTSASLFDRDGQRKYLNPRERKSFLKDIPHCFDNPIDRAFCYMLCLTGCRISEALEFSALCADSAESVVILRTLKTRSDEVFRIVPVPEFFMDMLQDIFIERDNFEARVWGFSSSLSS